MRSILIFATLAIANPVLGGGMQTPMQVRLELSLTDGSVMFGSPCPSSTSLKVHSNFGTLDIQLDSVQSFSVQDKGEKLVVQWSNGDRVSGGAGLNGLEVDTILGRLSVPLSSIKTGKVQLVPSQPPLRPVDVKASGTYAPRHKLEYAYDGKKGTSWSAGGWSGWIEFDLGEPTEIAKIDVFLAFEPTGSATHEIYISNEPMQASTKGGTLVKKFSGTCSPHTLLTTNCSPGTVGRYVQIRCPGGRAWFNIRELDIYPM